jgi:hypothetical protein
MKKFCILSVVILGILLAVQNTGAQTTMNYPVIGIQYIGPSDKPVTPIVISESKGDAEKFNKDILKRGDLEMTAIHIVTPPLMKELLIEVAKHYGSGNAKENGSQTGAVVSLTIIVGGKEQRVLLERQAGIEMLEQFSRICKKDSALRSDIILFKTRMSQW